MIYEYAKFSKENPKTHNLIVITIFGFAIACCVIATNKESFLALGGGVLSLPAAMFFGMASNLKRQMPL